ncbi:MBL fold metallo-hydrolase [Nocardia brasiliensis]|uniref:MBL fold metallo-hydrolase n=1 Tax=Nocardia brasiliensis TaxID=37326 RepID=UPI002453C47C|nr:MBL fold metallo-hydrolase [Nocardia brasiliensis]
MRAVALPANVGSVRPRLTASPQRHIAAEYLRRSITKQKCTQMNPPAPAFPTPIARHRLREPARLRSIRLGDLRITYVPDGFTSLKPSWLPDATSRDWRTYYDYLDDSGYLAAGIGGLLIENGQRALLIDSGLGSITIPDDPSNALLGPTRGGQLIDHLARLGRTPDQIDAVAFTHLHLDHVGGAATPAPGTELPIFARAEYLTPALEWSQWAMALTPEMMTMMKPKVRTFIDGEEVWPGVKAVMAPGHTVGHSMFSITSRGHRLLVLGDALHSPIQIQHPRWSAAVDFEPGLSAMHRQKIVDNLASSGELAFANHFADVVFGRVNRTSEGKTIWVPYDQPGPAQ